MRPLPRLLAITDIHVVGGEDFAIKAAAIASAGPTVGIVVRAPGTSASHQTGLLLRVRALVRPPEAAFLASGDPSLGAATGASGLELPAGGPTAVEARGIYPAGWIGVGVRSLTEAQGAVAGGADFLMAGPVFPSAADPGDPGLGLDWLRQIVALGLPVVACGGIGGSKIGSIRAAGAWGVGVNSALWSAADPARAADQFVRALAA